MEHMGNDVLSQPSITFESRFTEKLIERCVLWKCRVGSLILGDVVWLITSEAAFQIKQRAFRAILISDPTNGAMNLADVAIEKHTPRRYVDRHSKIDPYFSNRCAKRFELVVRVLLGVARDDKAAFSS